MGSRIGIRRCCAAIGAAAAVVLAMHASPAHAVGLRVKPHGGVGYASPSQGGEGSSCRHVGTRLLLPAGDTRAFGLEVTHIDVDVSADELVDTQYIAMGIVLEMTLWDHFNMAIGTIGYAGCGDNTANPFGIIQNLGWESSIGDRIDYYVTWRAERVFDDPGVSMNSLSLAVAFQL